MDDIYQTLLETVWISIPEFIRLAFAGMAGGLIGAYINDRLTRKRDKESGITSEKLILIPLVETLILNVNNCGNLLGKSRAMIRPQLQDSAMRLKVRLKNRKKDLRGFEAAWDVLAGTTDAEAGNHQHGTTAEAYDKQKRLLLSRLEAFRKVIHDT